MRDSFVALCVLSLVISMGACFDETPPGQTSAGTTGSTGDATGTDGPSPTTTEAATGSGGPGTTPSDGTSSGPSDDTTTDGGATTEVATTDDGGSSSSEGGSSSEESSTGTCSPPPDGGAAIGLDCAGGVVCPPGYTCQPFAGFVFQETCQIICTMDCECPMGMTCNETTDKTMIPWFQCS